MASTFLADSDLPHLAEIKQVVDAFPRKPGVYVMKDSEGEVIYIGKAKDLRARVRTYFLGGDGRAQIEFLVKRIRAVEKIVTESEHQAFVLERDLIGKYKPRYNIRLKDDKAFLCVRIDETDPWPRLELVRKIQEDNARYFGPYSFSYELRSLLDIIKRVIPLRTCTNTVFFNRQRPCLEYQIKRCLGPCCLPVDQAQYRAGVKQAIAILEGRTDQLIKDLSTQMERASQEMRFEDAAVTRDRIELLKNFTKGQSIVAPDGENRDVFALYREERLVTLAVLKMRFGRIADSTTFALSDVEISDDAILESAMSQFYEGGREIPIEILLPFELQNLTLVADELSAKAGHKIALVVPQRGVKKRMLGLAAMNAREHFLASYDSEKRYIELARKLAKLLSLRQIPRRIECVDISNFQGSDIVGALVSFFDGEPDKSRYRKYKISQQDKPDDFASIHEVVRRRLARGREEGSLPDLLIIDGGPGQLSMALAARDALNIDLDIVSLAKLRTEGEVRRMRSNKTSEQGKPERIYREGEPEPILLEGNDEVTHFLQRIRDEVHRFVITFHRKTRSKRVFRSVLDTIAGLGPERRGRLMRAYGSVARMKEAPAQDLAKNGRMPLPLAEKVLRIISQPSSLPESTD